MSEAAHELVLAILLIGIECTLEDTRDIEEGNLYSEINKLEGRDGFGEHFDL